jgi:hypothetical protein
MHAKSTTQEGGIKIFNWLVMFISGAERGGVKAFRDG